MDMKRIALVLAGVLAIGGCASTQTTIASDYTPGAHDESVAIGRVALDLQRPPGAFFATLPPGRYRFVSVHAMNMMSQLPSGRFDVEPARVQYLGTLRYRGIDITGGGRWLVEDESETTVKAFRERYPRLTRPVAMPKPEAWGVLGPAGWRIWKPQ